MRSRSTELTAVTDWPESVNDLRAIDSALRCAICFDYMKTCMIVPKCSHNYCSLCIRSYISNCKTQCPACNGGVTETDLRNNRALDDIIEHFLAIRPTLLQLVKANTDQSLPSTVGTSSVSLRKSPSKRTPDVKRTQSEGLENFIKRNPRGDNHNLKQRSIDSDDSDCEKDMTRNRSKLVRKSRVISSDSDFDVELISDDGDTDDDFTYATKSSSKSRVKKCKQGNTKTTATTPRCKSALVVNEVKVFPTTPSCSKVPPSELKNPFNDKNSDRLDCEDKDISIERGSSRRDEFDLFSIPPATSPLERTSSTQSVGQIPVSQSPSQLPQTRGNVDITSPGPSYGRVDCPVCGVSIPERNMNLHLDMCLSGSAKKESLRSSAPKRKPMPKLVYNLMKDAEIKKKLQAAGLPTQGDRKTLIKRLHEFTIMYNAECDSDNPKSGQEIAKEITKNEQLKAKMTTSNSVQGKLNLQKNASSEDVTKAQKSYVKQHKDHFSQLIADTKKRMMAKKKEKEAAQKADTGEDSRTEESLPNTSVTDVITSEDSSSHSSSVVFDLGNTERTNKSEYSFSAVDKEQLEMASSRNDMPTLEIVAGKEPEKEVPSCDISKSSNELISTGLQEEKMEVSSSDFSNFKALTTVPPPPSLPQVVETSDVYDDSTDDDITFPPNSVCKVPMTGGSGIDIQNDSQVELCDSPQTPGGSSGSESPSLLNPPSQAIMSTHSNDVQMKTDMVSGVQLPCTSDARSEKQGECVQEDFRADSLEKDWCNVQESKQAAPMSEEIIGGLVDSQGSSSWGPLSQIAPPSPESVGSLSSDRVLIDTVLGASNSLLPQNFRSKSSTPFRNGSEQALECISKPGLPVTLPAKKGKGRPKGRGQKRELTTIELPDSDFMEVKRVRLSSPAQGSPPGSDMMPVRRSSRQKKNIP